MAAPSFTIEVVTPTRLVIKARATSVKVPGVEGYLGILANHAPIVTELKIGGITVDLEDGSVKMLAISGGFLEVHENKVSILADTAERAEEIDTQRAEESKKRAEDRLSKGDNDKIDAARAQAALLRAMNRLRVYSEYHDLKK